MFTRRASPAQLRAMQQIALANDTARQAYIVLQQSGWLAGVTQSGVTRRCAVLHDYANSDYMHSQLSEVAWRGWHLKHGHIHQSDDVSSPPHRFTCHTNSLADDVRHVCKEIHVAPITTRGGSMLLPPPSAHANFIKYINLMYENAKSQHPGCNHIRQRVRGRREPERKR